MLINIILIITGPLRHFYGMMCYCKLLQNSFDMFFFMSEMFLFFYTKLRVPYFMILGIFSLGIHRNTNIAKQNKKVSTRKILNVANRQKKNQHTHTHTHIYNKYNITTLRVLVGMWKWCCTFQEETSCRPRPQCHCGWWWCWWWGWVCQRWWWAGTHHHSCVLLKKDAGTTWVCDRKQILIEYTVPYSGQFDLKSTNLLCNIFQSI